MYGHVCWHLAGGQQPRAGARSFCDLAAGPQTSITSAIQDLDHIVRADASGLSVGSLGPLDGAARQYWDSNIWLPDQFVIAGWFPEGRSSWAKLVVLAGKARCLRSGLARGLPCACGGMISCGLDGHILAFVVPFEVTSRHMLSGERLGEWLNGRRTSASIWIVC